MRAFAESLTHGEGRKSFPMFVSGVKRGDRGDSRMPG